MPPIQFRILRREQEDICALQQMERAAHCSLDSIICTIHASNDNAGRQTLLPWKRFGAAKRCVLTHLQQQATPQQILTIAQEMSHMHILDHPLFAQLEAKMEQCHPSLKESMAFLAICGKVKFVASKLLVSTAHLAEEQFAYYWKFEELTLADFANLLYSLATFKQTDPNLINMVIAELKTYLHAEKPPQEQPIEMDQSSEVPAEPARWSSQLTKLLWSLVYLTEGSEPDLLRTLCTYIDELAPNLSPVHVSQAFLALRYWEQFNRAAVPSPDTLLKLQSKVESLLRSLPPPKPSKFQQEVYDALRCLKQFRNRPILQEHQVGLYFIDLVLDKKRQIGIECDGPHHYLSTGNISAAEEVRNAILKDLQWTILHIPHTEWRALRNKRSQCGYLRRLIATR